MCTRGLTQIVRAFAFFHTCFCLKKQGIFSDSADLAKLLYYSLPGPGRKFRCLFYDQSWLINDFDHVNFLWHTKCRKLLSVIFDYYRIFN